MRDTILFGGKYKNYDKLIKFLMNKNEKYAETLMFAMKMLPSEVHKELRDGKFDNLSNGMNILVDDRGISLTYTARLDKDRYIIVIRLCNDYDVTIQDENSDTYLSSIKIVNLDLDETFNLIAKLEKHSKVKDALVIKGTKSNSGEVNAISFGKTFFEHKELPKPNKKR